MHRFILLLLYIGLGCSWGYSQETVDQIKVMAWNILHGARDIPEGVHHAIQIVQEIDPDIILMVETYGSGEMIANALGMHLHLVAPEGTPLDDRSINLSVMSKFPFGKRLDTDFPFYLGGREVIVGDRRIRCLSNWFYYLPSADEPDKMGMTATELLTWEQNGKRYEMIQKVLPYLEEYASEADSIPLILAGDMNSPSHLDWGRETKDHHNGLIVPWYSTKVLEDLGFIDTYRIINPSVKTHPGITWNVKGKRDEHRIDYIYSKGALTPIESFSNQAYLGEPLILNNQSIPFPSDHGFVVTTFKLE